MSITELERHLLDGLKKLEQECHAIQAAHDQRLNKLSAELHSQAQHMQQLSEFYKNLEPLLQQLNVLLRNAG